MTIKEAVPLAMMVSWEVVSTPTPMCTVYRRKVTDVYLSA